MPTVRPRTPARRSAWPSAIPPSGRPRSAGHARRVAVAEPAAELLAGEHRLVASLGPGARRSSSHTTSGGSGRSSAGRRACSRPAGGSAIRGGLEPAARRSPGAIRPRSTSNPNDQTVVAVGITFPAAHTPIDARIWLVHPDRLDWIDTQAIDPEPVGWGIPVPGHRRRRLPSRTGPPAGIGSTCSSTVPSAGSASRCPNRFEIVPDRVRAARRARPTSSTRPAARCRTCRSGLFVTTSGVSIPLRGRGGSAADRGRRLAGRRSRARAGRRAPTSRPSSCLRRPGSASCCRRDRSVRAIGSSPPDTRATPRRAGAGSRRRVAGRRRRPTSSTGRPMAGRGRPASTRFRSSGTDSSGPARPELARRAATRDRFGELPSMLLAARGFARYAGSTGVVVGTAEPLEGGPRSVAIRLLRASQGTGSGIPPRDRVPCDGVRVDGLSGVVGLAGPVDAPSVDGGRATSCSSSTAPATSRC